MTLIKQNSRIKHHAFSGLGVIPTVPAQEDFTDELTPWAVTDLADREVGVNSTDGKAWIRIGAAIIELNTGVVAGSLATADQSITDTVRDVDLFGLTLAEKIRFRDSAGGIIMEMKANRSIVTAKGKLTIAHPTNAIQMALNGDGGNYGYYTNGSNTVAHYAGDGSASRMFFARQLDGGQVGFEATGLAAAASLVRGFNAQITGVNTADNVGIIFDVRNGLNNYAIQIINGDIKTPTGLGQTETVTFGGGGSGNIATMTFDKGIYISKTLVP